MSVQSANQEIGTTQDIAAIGAICREREVLFHTDATHSFPRVPLDVSQTPVDLVTLASHLIHGPKGVAGLYVRAGTPLGKWMDGGFQEFNLRPGTENIPGAVGFARAVELVTPEETAALQGHARPIDRPVARDPAFAGQRPSRLSPAPQRQRVVPICRGRVDPACIWICAALPLAPARPVSAVRWRPAM